MKKYLLYTDVHFCQYSSILRKMGKKYSVRLHNLINSISWAEHLADEEGCDEVICLGDFFDRSDLNAMEITALQDVYFCNKPHKFLTGNHEANVASLDFSSVKVFESKNAEVIAEVKREEVNDKVDLYYIPYLTNDTIQPLSNYLVNNNKKKIVLSHNDIAGIQYGRFLSRSGFDVNDITNNCTVFINGHLHNGYMINDKIILIGDLTGQNFNEDAKKYEHCVYIMTVDDGGRITLEQRVNPYAYNFYKLYVNKEEDVKQLDNLKSNAVVSVSCNSRYLKEVEEKLHKPNIAEFKLLATYSNSSEEGSEEVVFNVDDHLKQFIDYVSTKIEPSTILSEEISLLGSSN